MKSKKTLSEQKREAILDAAITEFMENGFKGTSMDNISARADVSKRTVYNHFSSKEALFNAIMVDVWAKGLAATEFNYQPDQPLATQLSTIAKQELELLGSEDFISLSRLLLAEYFRSPDLAQQAMERISISESGLHSWLKAAMEEGRITKVNPEFAATQFLSLLKAFAFWPQIIGYAPFPSAEERENIIASAVEMFLNQYQLDNIKQS